MRSSCTALLFALALVAASLTLVAASGPAGAQRTKPRVYTPPTLDPEPEIEPAAEVASVEVKEAELPVLARPSYASPLLGAVVKGSRLAVRGTHDTPKPRGCPVKRWYALKPTGFVCSRGVRPSTLPPTVEPVLRVIEGQRLPYEYKMLIIPEGEEIPMHLSKADLLGGGEPERKLGRGDSVAVEKKFEHNGAEYYELVDGRVVPSKGFTTLRDPSAWQGIKLDATTKLPFGWITYDKTKVRATPDPEAEVLETVARRTKVDLLEDKEVEAVVKKRKRTYRFVRIGENRWVDATDVNEVRKLDPRPPGTLTHDQWIDVNLGEQVLVAYIKDQPVYATLISSGRAVRTPRGDYPIWAKASATNMKSQKYEDKHYYVHKVPWVLFFQAHNALHGAYWHDRFGQAKSHGCVNLAPLDARYLFDWVNPILPVGWNGIRPVNLLQSITVHVRDSRLKQPWVQQRPIGPPDKKEELKKLEEAEKRRAEAAAKTAAEAPGGAQPAAAPGVIPAATPAAPAKP